MSDIVDRLRNLAGGNDCHVAHQAADKIEAQQAEMEKRLRQQGGAWAADAKRKDAEIERLRRVLQDIADHEWCEMEGVIEAARAALARAEK